jgi:hypothetical protein
MEHHFDAAALGERRHAQTTDYGSGRIQAATAKLITMMSLKAVTLEN